MKIIPKSLGGSGIFIYLCSRYRTVVDHSAGRTSRAQYIVLGLSYGQKAKPY